MTNLSSESSFVIVLALAALCGLGIRAWRNPGVSSWLAVALAAMVASGVLQRFVEKRRVEEHLTWTDPQNKDAIETSLMALGSFRGLLADVLWVRASRLQDSARYYELKLLCELIQKLQPNFISVFAFQAHNMSYNLAGQAMSAEDKWYWTQSGLSILEKGLERNKHHYGLWFELGWQYLDRINDSSKSDWVKVRQRELPRLDDLTEAEREKVFLDPHWKKGRARKDECLRWAAYYFYKATQASGDTLVLRTERIFGNCLDLLGHWSSRKAEGQRLNWDDWGSEDWWIELRHRNEKRGMSGGLSSDESLKWCVMQQISSYQMWAEKNDKKARNSALSAQDAEKFKESARDYASRAQEAEKRFYTYFPQEKRPMTEVVSEFRKSEEAHRKAGSKKVPAEEAFENN